jgi:hypothetical protein
MQDQRKLIDRGLTHGSTVICDIRVKDVGFRRAMEAGWRRRKGEGGAAERGRGREDQVSSERSMRARDGAAPTRD